MKRALLLLLAACDSGSYYLYTGHAYEPQRDCVSDLVALDVEIGSDPGATCGAKCLAAPNEVDGGVQVYATTMCGPTPAGADMSGTNPQCANALAAFNRGDFCLDGGGSMNPLDAGAE